MELCRVSWYNWKWMAWQANHFKTSSERTKGCKSKKFPTILQWFLKNLKQIAARDWHQKDSYHKKLRRVLTWVFSFIHNTRLSQKYRYQSGLTLDELQDAKLHISKWVQQKTFKDEYAALKSKKPLSNKSRLIFLKPVLDEDGIIRADTRLQHAAYLPYDTRYPLILPRKDWVAKIIVEWHHKKANYVAGTSHTLSLFSARFWVL